MVKFLFLSCLLVTVVAAEFPTKKVSLEDIEKEYLTSERPPSQTQPKIANLSPSPTKFGFVPMRTASSYARNQPKTSFTQANYRSLLKGFTPSSSYPSQYSSQQYKVQYKVPQTYVVPDYSQQYASQTQDQKYLTTQQYYVPPQAQKPATQQYAFETQKYAQEQQYMPQAQQNYEQYENVQYITDNSIPQSSQQQYYTAPQYYYVQQYQAPSTSVQTVVDPKGVQYVAYVPSYSPNSIPVEQPTYETSYDSADSSAPAVPSGTISKLTVPKYQSKTIEYHPRKSPNQYQNTKTEFVPKREPKSLLESYIPSVVQLRYLEEQRKKLYKS